MNQASDKTQEGQKIKMVAAKFIRSSWNYRYRVLSWLGPGDHDWRTRSTACLHFSGNWNLYGI